MQTGFGLNWNYERALFANSWEIAWELPVDVILVDGDHSYDGVRQDVEKFSPFLKDGGFMWFHDYNNTYQIQEYIDKNMLEEWSLEEKEWSAILRKK